MKGIGVGVVLLVIGRLVVSLWTPEMPGSFREVIWESGQAEVSGVHLGSI